MLLQDLAWKAVGKETKEKAALLVEGLMKEKQITVTSLAQHPPDTQLHKNQCTHRHGNSIYLYLLPLEVKANGGPCLVL